MPLTGTPLYGTVPLTVQFTDTSTNAPTSWSWSFGDGGASTAQNPSHQYASAGTYTVSLTAANAAGSDGETKTGYVVVSAPQTEYKVYAEAGDGGTGIYDMADGFWDVMHIAQSGSISWEDWRSGTVIENTLARESHWTSNAANWVENADFVYFSGHGYPNGFNFDHSDEYSGLDYADASRIRLGSGNTKWAVIDSCESLKENSWINWQQSFTGLRMLLGWDTTTFPTTRPIGRGEMFAQLMMGNYPDPSSPVLTIKDAWKEAASLTMESYSPGEDKYTMAIYDTNCVDDKLPGWGGFSASPSNSQYYEKTLVAAMNLLTESTLQNSRSMVATQGKYSVNSTVPLIPDTIMIYSSENPGFSREWVNSLAKKLGMTGNTKETENAFYASDSDEKNNYFFVRKEAKVISFKKYSSDSGSPLSDEKAIEAVKKFLISSDLMPSDAMEPNIAYNTRTKVSASGKKTDEYKQIVVSFPRKLNGLMVWNSQLMVTLDSQGNIVGLFMNWRDYAPSEESSLKSPEQAFREFQTESSGISEKTSDKIEITKISLVYAEPPASSSEKELLPIYVFEGVIQNGERTKPFNPVSIQANQEPEK